MKRIAFFIIFFFLVSGCGGPTKVRYQEFPKEKTLAVKINGVTFRIVSFGTTKEWAELEVAVANDSEETVFFDSSQVFLVNEKGYDLTPLTGYEINERVQRKTGKWITPLTLAAAAAGIGAIVLPSSKDRTHLARAALGLAGAAVVSEVEKRQSADADIERKEDFLLKTYQIPPKLQIGGVLYYRKTEASKGVKAFIRVKGVEEFFQIEL